jgi:hypothetical protein
VHRKAAFPGLQAELRRLLDRLDTPGKTDLAEAVGLIRRRSEALERAIVARSVPPGLLTEETRNARGWLAFFSRTDNLEAYAVAVHRLVSGFQPAHHKRLPLPFSVHLRPMRGIFRLRATRAGTRLVLPTPAVSFDEHLFRDLAGLVLRTHNDRRMLLEAMAGERYQSVLQQIETLGGLAETTRGFCHDLQASFQRVNATYFDNAIVRPRLMWSRTFTRRKFGHYDPIHDTVMVSRSLDQASVPEVAVDFVMYHEMLHKQLGVAWQRGSTRVHTPEFRRRERQFHGRVHAERVLSRLAASRA